MYLVQILLPLNDNEGHRYSEQTFGDIQQSLVARFGGATAYSRAPAKGFWLDGNRESREDVIVIEVMTDALDQDWWHAFRKSLEQELGQKEIVIRAHPVQRL